MNGILTLIFMNTTMPINIETAEVPIVVNVANTKVFMVRYTEKDGTPYVNIFTGNTEGVEMPEAALVPLLSSLQGVNGHLQN